MKIKPTDTLPPQLTTITGGVTPLPVQRYEVVTAVQAREWLKLNTNNRPLRRAHVEELKRVFERNEYIITHQGIAFSTEGILLDGQHRLTALAEMPDDFSIVMSVTYGLDKEAFKVTDTHAKRSYADSLHIAPKLAEVARATASIVGGSRRLSTQALEPYVAFVRPYYEVLTRDLTAHRRTWSTAIVRTAAIIAMARGVSPDYVREIYRILVQQDYQKMPEIVQTMHRAESANRLKAVENNEMLIRCLKMFNPACSHLAKIHVGDVSAAVAEVREYLCGVIPGARQ